MLTSLAYIFLAGLALAGICQQLKIPRIIGMLAVGILLGPSVLNLLDPSILSVSADLRKMALIIILLKAGLSLNIADLKRVGRPAVMMSFVPASFEILGFAAAAPASAVFVHPRTKAAEATKDFPKAGENYSVPLPTSNTAGIRVRTKSR